ncbi:hypothetical protein [Nonomuraea typhae]|uniref:hypothetical protein n=1 Tax=Nonomuraea typhae TaxID=2603600 RepID=UPI0012F7DAD1|nr:hypothetical protein [Nonomuraea typhae]
MDDTTNSAEGTEQDAASERIQNLLECHYLPGGWATLDPDEIETALSDLFADLAHYFRHRGIDPLEPITRGLWHAEEEVAGWNTAQRHTYFSLRVAPLDGRYSRKSRETTDLEVAIVRHQEVSTKTALRTVVRDERRLAAAAIHELEELDDGPVGAAARQLWQDLEDTPLEEIRPAGQLGGQQ